MFSKQTLLFGATLMVSATTFGHGLIEDPPARNWICGAETKPDQVLNGVAKTPACGKAFENDFSGGYQFMSVLTHAQGRQKVSPLPENVCGFDSETWQGGKTPWDTAMDWPTTDMSAGRQPFVWNISWGPHFDDTEEFVYYITKPGFQFDPNRALRWSDFEEQPFCSLKYQHSQPNANPDVIPNPDAAKFTNYCTVPERSGRHVIYAEWGRNYYTYERFHSCVDVSFNGSNPPVNLAPAAQDLALELVENSSVALTLRGSDSDGSVVDYEVLSQPSNGNLSGTAPNLVYTPLAGFIGLDSFTYRVRDNHGANSNSATVNIDVKGEQTDPENNAPVARFTAEVNDLNVSFDASASSDADGDNLTYSWNFGDGNLGSGALVSHSYAVAGNYEVRLNVSDGQTSANTSQSVVVREDSGEGKALCDYVLDTSWQSGFVARIRITNTSDETINGWNVNWQYSGNSRITNSWNIVRSGDNPYSAAPLDWNRTIAPGQTVEFGFQGSRSGEAVEIPTISGDVCR